MKKIFTLLVLLPTSICASAQYTSVGIGISAPTPATSLLDIQRGWGDYIEFKRTQNNGFFGLHNSQNGDDLSFYYQDPLGIKTFSILVFQNDAKVRMGDVTTPGDYKLYVEKGILTEKVRVAVKGTTSWADHVFAPEYKLMPLKELQTYISKNKHLPEIPSAQEVIKDGVDLGTMDAKLLQKIEELTLYVIQQQKEIEELKQKIEEK